MDIFPFQFYVGLAGLVLSVFSAGYVCGNKDSLWFLTGFIVCGVLCASMAVARLNDVLKELRQLRVWHGEDLRRRQEEANTAHLSEQDQATDPGISTKAR